MNEFQFSFQDPHVCNVHQSTWWLLSVLSLQLHCVDFKRWVRRFYFLVRSGGTHVASDLPELRQLLRDHYRDRHEWSPLPVLPARWVLGLSVCLCSGYMTNCCVNTWHTFPLSEQLQESRHLSCIKFTQPGKAYICVLPTKTHPLFFWLKNSTYSTHKEQHICTSLFCSFCLEFFASWN